MIVGKRDETLQEKTNRHITEMKSEIEGWKNEMVIAEKYSDELYEKYCQIMIGICENTISELEMFATQHFKIKCVD